MRDHPWRPRRTVAAVVLGTALLTGCSGATAEAPSESLPSTSSAAPTTEALPAVGPADFPVPPEARTQDAAGAEAFLRYWIELLNRQQAIPAGQPLRDLGPDCQECQRIARVFDEAAVAGHTYRGGEVILNDVPTPVLNAGVADIAFGARANAVSKMDRSGNAVGEGLSEEPNLGSGIRLTWSSDVQSWLVTAFNLG